MRRFRTLALSVAVAALVVSAFGAPAAAAFGKGSIAVVNGRPGPALDFCIGYAKVKRSVPYGGKYFRQLNQGNKLLRAFVANGRAHCGGTKVAHYPFSVEDGGDLTLVVTRKTPKVVEYDNFGNGSVQVTGTPLSYWIMLTRTASDIAAVNVYYRVGEPFPDTPLDPSAIPVFVKGDGRSIVTAAPGLEWQSRATFPEQTKSIAIAHRQALDVGRRYEWILVGTTGRNARWVKLSRAIYSDGS